MGSRVRVASDTRGWTVVPIVKDKTQTLAQFPRYNAQSLTPISCWHGRNFSLKSFKFFINYVNFFCYLKYTLQFYFLGWEMQWRERAWLGADTAEYNIVWLVMQNGKTGFPLSAPERLSLSFNEEKREFQGQHTSFGNFKASFSLKWACNPFVFLWNFRPSLFRHYWTKIFTLSQLAIHFVTNTVYIPPVFFMSIKIFYPNFLHFTSPLLCFFTIISCT